MNILHISASDHDGGAAKAAYRIHLALTDEIQKFNSRSHFFASRRISSDPSVYTFNNSLSNHIRHWRNRFIAKALDCLQLRSISYRSYAMPGRNIFENLPAHVTRSPLIINLHWLGNDSLSIKGIGSLAFPVVWTLHDLWAVLATRHYFEDHKSNLPTDSQIQASKLKNSSTTDSFLDKYFWNLKARHWNNIKLIIAPSSWVANLSQSSPLTSHIPVLIIPHPLDLQLWRPYHPIESRRFFGLPERGPLILFGAVGGVEDPRKGADLLFESLSLLQDLASVNASIVIFGQSKPAKCEHQLPLPIRYMAHISDELTMARLYSACDVMVVPSRQETFGQTASEAQACGVPVVGFQVGGLVDIVEQEQTGFLVKPFDSVKLSCAIRRVVTDSKLRHRLSLNARTRAKRLWCHRIVARQYNEAYKYVAGSFFSK